MAAKHRVPFMLFIALLVSSLAGCSRDGNAEQTVLRVMTFNLRTAATIDQFSWVKRRPVVRELLLREKPDIIGTQEGTYAQLVNIAEDSPSYQWIGEGREGNNRGEFAAVFFNKARLKPLDQGHFWLSNTPDVPGSITWGNAYPRMATWVKFQDVRTRKTFYVINTHFDHQSELSRQKSAELIIRTADTFEAGVPVLVTGDFNSRQDGYSHDIFMKKGGMKDAYMEAAERINENYGTIHHFTDPSGGGKDNKIDWILYRGDVTVLRGEVVTFHADGQYPSDHYPVMADVTLGDRHK
jgi:endonuclease/exonuclease/phosphatase family metal-dependent hydrolase